MHKHTTAAHIRRAAILALLSAAPTPSLAGSFELGPVEGDYKIIANYGVGIRIEKQSQNLINGPVDAFVVDPTGPERFGHTGLPTTINADDGDRNFNRYSLVNNRVSTLGELRLNYDDYGLALSGDAFYDFVYRDRNDNTSPDTINKTGPVDEFTAGTRKFDGQRARLLEAYVFGNAAFGDEGRINLRVGRHLVAWGESLFFSGLALAQGRADATKAVVPGVEVKEILLPTNQISTSIALNNSLTLLGYYKLEFKETEIFPVGDYLSPTDVIGPGGTFAHGSANPLAGEGCPGVLSSLLTGIPTLGPALGTALGVVNINPDQLCDVNGATGIALDAPRTVKTYRLDDIRPSKGGQYGLGLRYQLASGVLGLYYIRYHDAQPTVKLNYGTLPLSNNPALAPILTTALLGPPVPASYQVKYFDGIDMGTISYSTLLGSVNVAGEVSYRHGYGTAAEAVASGVVVPIFTRSDIAQAQVSAIHASSPGFGIDDLALVGEAGVVRVIDIEPIPAFDGQRPSGDGDTPFYSRTSYAVQALAVPTKRNIIDGWNLSVPLGYAWLIKGNPALAGAFGALYGDGDMRVSVGATAQSVGALSFGVAYNVFLGDDQKLIGNSNQNANPFADRDYATFFIKYNL